MDNASAQPLRAGILVVSDSRSAGAAADEAGPQLETRLVDILPNVETTRRVVPDEVDAIQTALRRWTDGAPSGETPRHLVLTSGGTGFAPRDVTPEATRPLLERRAPGLVVAMIQAGLAKTPYAMLSRPAAGVRGRTLIVNLPGSPTGAIESLDAIAPALGHALALLRETPTAHR